MAIVHIHLDFSAAERGQNIESRKKKIDALCNVLEVRILKEHLHYWVVEIDKPPYQAALLRNRILSYSQSISLVTKVALVNPF